MYEHIIVPTHNYVPICVGTMKYNSMKTFQTVRNIDVYTIGHIQYLNILYRYIPECPQKKKCNIVYDCEIV